MRQSLQQFASALGIVVVGFVGVASARQTTTSATEVKKFEVVSVSGNKLVARDASGTKEYTVPADFKFMVDGHAVSIAEIKPGMKGSATITTTTTVTPVRVTEVRNGEVLQASGNSLLIKGPNGIRMFSPGDMEKRNVTIMKDGKPVDFSSLHAGDHLTATIITEGPPKVLTERQVQAVLSGAPMPAASAGTGSMAAKPAGSSTSGAAKPATAAAKPAASTAKPASSASAGEGKSASGAKKLPKTASDTPLVGLMGLVLMSAAAAMTFRRRFAVR